MEKINSFNDVRVVQSCMNTNGPTLDKCEFKIPFEISLGLVKIVRVPNDTILQLKDSVDKDYMKGWKNDVGGLLVKDIKGNNLDHYYEFADGNTVYLLREVTPDIEDSITEKGLASIKYGESKYVFIRTRHAEVSYGGEYHNFRYEAETVEEEPDAEPIQETEPKCIELF